MSDLKSADRCVHNRSGEIGTVKNRWEGGNGDIPTVEVWWDDGEISTEPVSAVTSVEDCPECDFGVVIPDGPMESDTGHWPLRCSHRCGWSS